MTKPSCVCGQKDQSRGLMLLTLHALLYDRNVCLKHSCFTAQFGFFVTIFFIKSKPVDVKAVLSNEMCACLCSFSLTLTLPLSTWSWLQSSPTVSSWLWSNIYQQVTRRQCQSAWWVHSFPSFQVTDLCSLIATSPGPSAAAEAEQKRKKFDSCV